MPPCPPPIPYAVPTPPEFAMCMAVFAKATTESISLKKQMMADETFRTKQKPKQTKMMMKELLRRTNALQRANKREEKDIDERMTRAKR